MIFNPSMKVLTVCYVLPHPRLYLPSNSEKPGRKWWHSHSHSAKMLTFPLLFSNDYPMIVYGENKLLARVSFMWRTVKWIQHASCDPGGSNTHTQEAEDTLLIQGTEIVSASLKCLNLVRVRISSLVTAGVWSRVRLSGLPHLFSTKVYDLPSILLARNRAWPHSPLLMADSKASWEHVERHFYFSDFQNIQQHFCTSFKGAQVS